MPLGPTPRPRPEASLLTATGLLAILAPLPLLFLVGTIGTPFGAPWEWPSTNFYAITVALVGAAVAGFLELRRGRLPAAILAATLYGVFAGTEAAVAAFFTAYNGLTLTAVPFGLLVLPAAAAIYFLVKEWVRTLAHAPPANPRVVERTVRSLGTIYAGYAALEVLGFLSLFAAFTAPCDASGSQTSCSSPRELAAMGTIGMVFVVPIVVTFTLGPLLEHGKNALLRSAGPPPTAR